MTDRRPLLIVSLPGRSVETARAEAEAALAAGADLAEVRIDRWTAPDQEKVAGLFPSPIPLVATYRSRAEGGEGTNDPSERGGILQQLEGHPFRFVDHEMERDATALTIDASRPAVILSRHLPAGAGAEEIGRALMADPAGAEFVKVVVPSTVGEALGPLRAAVPARGVERVVFHTTGPSGPLYRAWAWRLGFSAIYCSLPEGARRPPVEPSQIPVDHLRHFLGGSAPGPLFAVVGHPIGHTRSPGLFHAWMRARGDRGLYVGLDVATEAELAEVVPALAESGFRGLNVTRPWKQAALELASRIGPGAGPCGCANVLSFTPGGGIEAENTDLAALLRRLRELIAESEWDGERLTVVGSGGAARAALAAAQVLRAEATVVARDRTAASRVARDFGAEAATAPSGPAPELLVNTTPVGRSEAGALGVAFEPWVAPGTRLIDLVYDPDEPVLRRLAEARGARYEDGWRLLVYQAAESYALWWGTPPSESDLLAAIRGAL